MKATVDSVAHSSMKIEVECADGTLQLRTISIPPDAPVLMEGDVIEVAECGAEGSLKIARLPEDTAERRRRIREKLDRLRACAGI